MKKILLLVIFLLITTNVSAESPTEKGVYSLGGSISYSHDSADGSDSNRFRFYPSFQYFIYDKVAVGASLGYGKFSADSYDSESYGIGPTLRYYLPNETVNPFFEVSYLFTKTESESSLSTSESTSNDYSIGFGLNYFLSRNVSLEPIIRYSWFNSDTERDYIDELNVYSPAFERDEESLYIGIGINWFIF